MLGFFNKIETPGTPILAKVGRISWWLVSSSLSLSQLSPLETYLPLRDWFELLSPACRLQETAPPTHTPRDPARAAMPELPSLVMESISVWGGGGPSPGEHSLLFYLRVLLRKRVHFRACLPDRGTGLYAGAGRAATVGV